MLVLCSIDPQLLATVTGGADDGGSATFGPGAGPNRFRAHGQLEGSAYGVTIKGQGTLETARTNYATCLDAARSAEERKACLPLAAAPQVKSESQ